MDCSNVWMLVNEVILLNDLCYCILVLKLAIVEVLLLTGIGLLSLFD